MQAILRMSSTVEGQLGAVIERATAVESKVARFDELEERVYSLANQLAEVQAARDTEGDAAMRERGHGASDRPFASLRPDTGASPARPAGAVGCSPNVGNSTPPMFLPNAIVIRGFASGTAARGSRPVFPAYSVAAAAIRGAPSTRFLMARGHGVCRRT